MAKEQDGDVTKSPVSLNVSEGVFYEDTQDVIKALNYAAFQTPETHFSFVSGPEVLEEGTHGSNTHYRFCHGTVFKNTGSTPSPSGIDKWYEFRIWVDADVQEVRFEAVCTLPSGHGCNVQYMVDTTSAFNSPPTYVDLDFDSTAGALNNEKVNSDQATSTIGTGWLHVRVYLDHYSGTSTACILEQLLIENRPVSAGSGMPDPVHPL